MIFEKNRWEVWNLTQHPYKHSLAEFSYVNPALPGVTNVQGALNYILAVLYPQTKENVPTVADLPTVGNVIGDYRIVDDDGDGKSAGYRYEQREGDVEPQWYKIFDVDWSTDAILAALTNITDFKYVIKFGRSDLDVNGDPVTGLYAGQTVFGGNLANQNLTLHPNSGDGTGPQTGFTQIDGQFRPTLDATYDLSTLTERWRDAFFSGTIEIGTLSLTGSVISDSSGLISFDDENLITTGNIEGAILTGLSLVADDTFNTVTLVPGSYTDTTGSIAFGAANLSTTGTLGAGVTTLTKGLETVTLDPDNGGNRASITASLGAIDFIDSDLYTTGVLDVGSITTPQLDVGSIQISGNTISTTSGDLILNPTGVISLQKTLSTLDVDTTGVHTITGMLNVDNVRIDGNTIQAVNLNGGLTISVNGGDINFGARLLPTVSGSFDIGAAGSLLNDVFISGGIRNASNEMGITTLLAFRNGVWRDIAQTDPAQTNDALFYDGVNNVWLASPPDSEIDHATISGLSTGDAGHTQFVMLAGRAGGQTIQGGTEVSESLFLGSTSSATKGQVRLLDSLYPDITAAFSAGWSGVDLGGSSNYYNDIYSRGEHKGLRFENFTEAALPVSSGQNTGRVMWATDTEKAYVDTGAQVKPLGVSKFIGDQVFDGVQLFLDVDVSSEITNARNCIFSLLNNADNFSKMYVTLKATSASIVRIETDAPLPAGSYRLIVIE